MFRLLLYQLNFHKYLDWERQNQSLTNKKKQQKKIQILDFCCHPTFKLIQTVCLTHKIEIKQERVIWEILQFRPLKKVVDFTDSLRIFIARGQSRYLRICSSFDTVFVRNGTVIFFCSKLKCSKLNSSKSKDVFDCEHWFTRTKKMRS